jgi:hypothetical protein
MEIHRHIYENIKMDLNDLDGTGTGWGPVLGFVVTVMNLSVP